MFSIIYFGSNMKNSIILFYFEYEVGLFMVLSCLEKLLIFSNLNHTFMIVCPVDVLKGS